MPKKANHGSRPCSSVGRKSRRTNNRIVPIYKTWPIAKNHRRKRNLELLGKTHWKQWKKRTPQEVVAQKIYIAERLKELALVPKVIYEASVECFHIFPLPFHTLSITQLFQETKFVPKLPPRMLRLVNARQLRDIPTNTQRDTKLLIKPKSKK